MEDAMILNKSSVERGLHYGQVYKSETIDLTDLRQRVDGITNVFARSGAMARFKEHADKSAKFIDVDGLPYIGHTLADGDLYCSVLNKMTGVSKLSKLKGSEAAIVDYVAAINTGSKDPLQKVVMLVIWAFISFPLALFGTVVGRNWSGQPDNPCRVKTIPCPIPDKKRYLKPAVVALLGGLLPFGSIFIEMYFIFTSFWQYKVYYVYGFMLLVFIILTIVTVCVTIVATYFLLNAENYHRLAMDVLLVRLLHSALHHQQRARFG